MPEMTEMTIALEAKVQTRQYESAGARVAATFRVSPADLADMDGAYAEAVTSVTVKLALALAKAKQQALA